MSLIIHKVVSASTKIEYNSFDSLANFGYTVNGTYTVALADVSLSEGDTLATGQEALRKAYRRQNIAARIGTDIFESGQIKSISFSPSSKVGNEEATIEIEERKRVLDSSDNPFWGAISSPQNLESFQESFEFTRRDGGYSYSRNVSIKYAKDTAGTFVTKAYIFLKNFYIKERPSYGFQSDGISEKGRFDGGFKPLITEKIDLINNEVSLTENFQADNIKGNYSELRTFDEVLTPEGFKEKNFSIKILGVKEPVEHNAHLAIEEIIAELVSSEATSYGNPHLIEKTVNKDGAEAGLTISFSTDPSKNQSNAVSYNVGKQKRGNFFDYPVNYSIVSDGVSYEERFTNAKTYWKNNKTLGSTKVDFFFQNAGNIYEKSRQTTLEKLAGKITEVVTYTDDPSYNSASFDGGGVLKYQNNLSYKDQVNRTYQFLDLDSRYEMFAVNGLKTIGSATLTKSLVVKNAFGFRHGYNLLRTGVLGQFNLPSNGYTTSKTIDLDIGNGVTIGTIGYSFHN